MSNFLFKDRDGQTPLANPNREFFRIKPERVMAILKLLQVSDVTVQVESELVSNVEKTDLESGKKYKKNISRNSLKNLETLKIPVGSILQSTEGKFEVKFLGKNKVEYNGEEMSLTECDNY